MKKTIDRLNYKNFDYDEFFHKYIKAEVPVVVEGVFTCDTEKLTPEFIKARFTDENKREIGWYDADLVDDEVIKIPDFVKRTMQNDAFSVRESPMRLFMQPRGHMTLPHYDGNSLNGLNMQISGKKRWILTSPNTPLPCTPFMFAALVGKDFEYDPEKYDFYDFFTEPGDVAFIPRYWCHEVHSLGEVNLNLNWVFTPVKPDESTKLGRREVEIVKLRKTWPFVNKALFPDNFSKYGGKGEPLITEYSQHVSLGRMVFRFLREIAGYPRLIMLGKQLKMRAAEFSKNNFNV